MEKTQSLNKIYTLYSEGKYSEAAILNNQILEQEPENIYAKRYQNLLTKKIKSISEPERKGPIPTVKGKSLKCPHCIAKIALSGLTQGQKDKIRQKDFNNLEIKCPYCHTVFMLQKRKARSMLGIKLGEKIIYKQKSYRTVGYIEYLGKWYEGGYSGKVWYIEWILLCADNSYLYFSEGYSQDEGNKKSEFDFSYKTIPKHPSSVNFSDKTFTNQGIASKMKEYSEVSVKSAYGENSKSFKIGEKVILAPKRDIGGKLYVYEQESSGTQKEVGIYETDKTNENLARQIFNKAPRQETKSLVSSSLINKLLLFIVVGPMFMYFLVMPLTNALLESKNKELLENIDVGKKYELEFSNSDLKTQKTTSTKKYDYGGVKTYYESNQGIKFSIETQEDKEIIKKITEIQSNDYGNTQQEEKLVKFFEGILYKLK